jgi:hypothetical protein
MVTQQSLSLFNRDADDIVLARYDAALLQGKPALDHSSEPWKVIGS